MAVATIALSIILGIAGLCLIGRAAYLYEKRRQATKRKKHKK